MHNPMSLENKKIIVTGAASGIGKTTAKLICELGGHVFLLDLDEDGMNHVLKDCSKMSQAKCVNLCHEEETNSAVLEAVSMMGRFDGLVHCAGIASVAPVPVLSKAKYEQVMSVNTTAALTLSKLFRTRKVHAEKNSSIVLISSVYGVVGSACNAAYAASKAAIIGMTKALGIEFAPRGIRVNCVVPGFIKTNMADGVEAKFDKEHGDLIELLHPLGGWGEEIDIANGIVFLLSDASKWMTGSVLTIDGGYTAQ